MLISYTQPSTLFARYSGNITVWIMLFFLLRLYGITNAPLEHPHNWRQATGTMVARNFLETNNNIFYPRVDETNGGKGIIGMEFPLFNYLIYLVSLVFGYQHWYGRLINLLVSSVGVYYFYQVVRRYIYPPAALPAAIILLASLWFSFSRKIMPDTFSLSLCIVGLYYGLCYLSSCTWLSLLLFVLFTMLGGLSKIPSLLLSAYLLIPWLSATVSVNRKVALALAGLLILAPIVYWYFVWCPYLSLTYGSWYNGGKSLAEGATDIMHHLPKAATRVYFDGLRYIGFTMLLVGMVQAVRKRNKLLLYILALSIPLTVGYVLKSGYFFVEHDYYILPLVPLMALLAGYAISLLPNGNWQALVLCAIAVESIANQNQDFFVPAKELYRPNIEQVAQLVPTNALVAVSGGPNPQMLYFSHRKGWASTVEDLRNHRYIEAVRAKGCKYVLADISLLPEKLPYPMVLENSHFRLYRLQ